jgi:phenylacetate-CoA oxygenase PaaH subunit
MLPELDAVYEVFLQIGGPGRPIQLVGSVRASDDRLAWQSAKEIFTRRENCTALWVVPRDSIFVGEGIDLEVLKEGTGRKFRVPGYPSGHRRDRGSVGLVEEVLGNE